MSKRKKLLVCMGGKACPKMDSGEVYDYLKKAVADCGLKGRFRVKKVGCLDECKYAPVVKVDGSIYGHLSETELLQVTLRHAEKKKPVKKLLAGKKKRK